MCYVLCGMCSVFCAMCYVAWKGKNILGDFASEFKPEATSCARVVWLCVQPAIR